MSDILADILEVLVEVVVDSLTDHSYSRGSSGLFDYHPRRKVTVKKQTKTNENYFTPLKYTDENSFTNDHNSIHQEASTVKELEPAIEDAEAAIVIPTIMAMDALQDEEEKEEPIEETQTYEAEDDPIEQYQNNHRFSVNKAKLEILLLSYIYTEDDGKLSFSEKSKIKNHFRSFKGQLNDEDLLAIKDLITMEPSLNNIRAHINQNLMNDNEVDFVLNTIQDFCGLNKDYKRIMNRVKKSLKNTINY